jgi:hypothetical protein
MNKPLSVLIFAAFLGASIHASAAENTIRLICKYSHTIDDQGKSSGTSGEDLITVKYSSNGKAVIKKQDLGAEFTGTVNEEQISGETRYKMQDSVFHQTLLINRYTGTFEITFGIEGKNGGLIHYGKCKPATEILF